MNKILALIGILLFSGQAVHAQDDAEVAKALRESRELTHEAGEALEDNAFVLAEAKYRRAIAKSEKNVAAPYNLGNAYYGKKNYSEAFGRYKMAAETAEGKAEKHKAFHNMGNVFMQHEEYEKAIEAYKEALRNDPSDDETRYNLALAKEMLEKNPPDQQDKDGEDDKKQPQDNENKEKNQDQNQKPQDQQQQDQEKKDGDQGEEEKEDNKRGEGDEKKEQENKPQQPGDQERESPPRPNQLSPQQVKNLLEAMKNEERKVQEKLDAKKIKGAPAKNKKDW